jgi:hypothetical protein
LVAGNFSVIGRFFDGADMKGRGSHGGLGVSY